MKPLEIKLNRQFKALQKELEDYWFEEGNDKISEFADKIAREEYFKIQDIAKEIEKECKREDFAMNDELKDILNKFVDRINNFEDYLNPKTKGGFQKELFEATGGKSKEIIDKIKEIEAIAYYSNLQKLANQIDCMTWQSIGRMTFIINTSVEEIMPVYKNAMNDEIIKVKEMLDKKVKEILTKIPQENEENVESRNKNIKKIFDYKEMDRLIKLKGYESQRQTGDHKIYTNGTKTIPVPQHQLGKGLSCKIQKQII